MKTILAICLLIILMSFTAWQTDFEKAKQEAKIKHELILLNFSGSDWCGPCIRMRKDIFDNPAFLRMADTSLVLVNADFPRNKKNKPDNRTKEQNELLADKYNPDGKFPYTLLLNENGKIVKAWDGLPKESGGDFAAVIRKICDGYK